MIVKVSEDKFSPHLASHKIKDLIAGLVNLFYSSLTVNH